MVRVKICGIQDEASAVVAAEAGASAIGFIFAAESRRRVEPAHARAIGASLPPFVSRVGVVVNESLDGLRALIEAARLDTVQLHGDETADFCGAVGRLGVKVIKALQVSGPLDVDRIAAHPVAGVLLDTHRAGQRGGTGETFDWRLARPLAARMPVILSGGLSPENVSAGIRSVQPYGVDVSSGVETDGRKDHAKILAFVAAARAADAYAREVQR